MAPGSNILGAKDIRSTQSLIPAIEMVCDVCAVRYDHAAMTRPCGQSVRYDKLVCRRELDSTSPELIANRNTWQYGDLFIGSRSGCPTVRILAGHSVGPASMDPLVRL